MKFTHETAEAAKNVKLLAMDCDGVLTDGRLYYGDAGESMKAFHVHDGQGIVSWIGAGLKCAVISARSSGALEIRARELGIDFVSQGVKEKLPEIELAAGKFDIPLRCTAFIGDDLGDIPVMRRVGFPVAVADAVAEVRSTASYVTSRNGGRGAVREVVDLLFSMRNLDTEK